MVARSGITRPTGVEWRAWLGRLRADSVGSNHRLDPDTNLGDSASVSDPRGIAKGISEALSTTIVGLAIAIPSLIFYSYFSKKVEVMAAEMETLIADLIAKCYFQKRRRDVQNENYEGL